MKPPSILGTELIGEKQKIPCFHCATGFPKIIVPRLCGYCGSTVDSIISIFTLLHRSGFNLEFETLFESI